MNPAGTETSFPPQPRTVFLALSALLVLSVLSPAPVEPSPGAARSVIVQAADLDLAAAAVLEVGGEITHRLGIVGAVGAELAAPQLAALERLDGLRIHDDGTVAVAGGGGGQTGLDARYPSLVRADLLHGEGITGRGVTIAFVDTGIWARPAITRDTDLRRRILAQYDAIADRTLAVPDRTTDDCGHGTHVTGIALSSARTPPQERYRGIAPDADLVMVKAFGAGGVGTYADVLRGLDWILTYRAAYGIRVLNLSLAAPVRSYYWDDPINQAVMKLWQAGIAVVVSAGNGGPEPMTVGVPANVPYVITAGAMSDNRTDDPGDDFLASFSAAGPTVEAFVKPELVAPGSHLSSLMHPSSQIARGHPELREQGGYFTMSGTSQAAAVVSGVAALVLAADPSLDPDGLKCRLMRAGRPAVDPEGGLTYGVFQQGAGLVDAYGAATSTVAGCANRGLDVDADVAGVAHFHGFADRDAGGSYYLTNRSDEDAYSWDGGYTVGGVPFIDGYQWAGGYPFLDGVPFIDSYPFLDGVPFIDASPWVAAQAWAGDTYPQTWTSGLGETLGINVWVDGE